MCFNADHLGSLLYYTCVLAIDVNEKSISAT